MQYTAKIVAAERVTVPVQSISPGEYFEWNGRRHIRRVSLSDTIDAVGPGGESVSLSPREPVHPLPPPTWATEPELVRFDSLEPRALFMFKDGTIVNMKCDAKQAVQMSGQTQAFGVFPDSFVVPVVGKLEVTRGEAS